MVLTEQPDHALSSDVIDRLQWVLAEPIDAYGEMLQLTASIGVAAYPQDGSEGEALIERADVAMYHAKQSGRDAYRFYAEINGALI
ncbi:MAG TPA: diguanylate cyclase, partial [Burkholderiaceae bacterium]